MVKFRNDQTVAVRLLKVNIYDLGVIPPGEEVYVVISAETVRIMTVDAT